MKKELGSYNSIGIIDADLLDNGTRHPNLALMKIAGYYKSLGSQVHLIEDYEDVYSYDHVFVSKVFSFTSTPNNLDLNDNYFSIGGTGFFQDGGAPLDYEIEHAFPDYELYLPYIQKKILSGKPRTYFSDYLDYSIGFTTRGCFRKCDFCVNKKYDKAQRHSPVSEFLDSERPYIYLWDDNFFAYSGWESILAELENTKKPFQFRQGLDIRLLNEKRAKKISTARYKGDFIFAFDHIEDSELISEKLTLWRKNTRRGTRLYVLCAYDSQDIQDLINTFDRIQIIMSFGCLPYIMRHELYNNSEFKDMYTNLARWCNQPQFFKKMSFRQFCEACQLHHKTPGTFCRAFDTMRTFEMQYPDIAKKYFDLRFEEQTKY